MEGIEKVDTINPEKIIVIDDNGTITKKDHNIIYTSGINLIDVRYIKGIDLTKTKCNDVFQIYETFGIEAARASLIKELTYAYENAGTYVNYQWLSLISDSMTNLGKLSSIDRFGMNKSDAGTLSRCSFENTVDHLINASVIGETDDLKGVSAQIIVGKTVSAGTGITDVILDVEMLQSSEFVEKTEIEKTAIQVSKNNINEHIMNKEIDEDQNMFIPGYF